jgi:hypothetical protein
MDRRLRARRIAIRRDEGRRRLRRVIVLAKLVAADTVLSQVDVSHLCALDVRVASAPSLTQGGSCA